MSAKITPIKKYASPTSDRRSSPDLKYLNTDHLFRFFRLGFDATSSEARSKGTKLKNVTEKDGFFLEVFMRKIAIAIIAMGLTACGGSGGGANGSSRSPAGSATFENLSAGSSSVQCVKNNALLSDYAVPSNSIACANAGGIWHSTNVVTTADICRLNGVDFFVVGGGNATGSHQTACTIAGGAFVASTTQNAPYCSGYAALTCGGAGGTQITVDSVTGDINQSSANLVAGNNAIFSDASLTLLIHGYYDGMNVREYPVYFSVVSTITYLGSDFWTATVSKPTSSSFSNYFGYDTDAPSFTVSLPVGTSMNVKIESATLYTGR
jgi:hypothetical protein